MTFVDVHAHLDLGEFDSDMETVLDKCGSNNVKVIIANGIDHESNKRVVSLSSKFDIIKPALGIYPTDTLKYNDSEFNEALEFIRTNKPIAVGEIGLDYKEVEEEKRELVEKRFRMQVELAKEMNLPIIVHTRKAEERVIEVLEELQPKKVVMHCFCGKKKLVERIIANKWSFSIPATVIYAEQFQQIVEKTPLKQLLTETDAPYLSPDKTGRNDPSVIPQIVKKIAEIKGLDPIEAENIIFMNYQEMFT